MKRTKQKGFWLLKLLTCLLVAGCFSVLADLLCACMTLNLQPIFVILTTVVLTFVFFISKRITGKKLLAAAGIMVLTVALVCGSIYGIWQHFSVNAVYKDVDIGKTAAFAGRRVMLFVPHEDDELNVFGGLFEEYEKYGSELYVVYTSSGDFSNIGKTRMQEAIRVMAKCGVPEDHVIFLGFGNEWKGNTDIYNAEPDEVLESYNGIRQAYGTDNHPAYREGQNYTRRNYIETFESLLEKYRPDVVFCTDYDSHIDHRSHSLLFDEAMGRVLKQNADYRPIVYKGYAYATAFLAEDDFYAVNLAATKNPVEGEYLTAANLFRWQDRIRFPVNAGTLSRSKFSSAVYQATVLYRSQFLHQLAGGIINGDKVFWQRETESLLYNAAFSAKSGDVSLLHDFCLLSSNNLADMSRPPYDSVWCPQEKLGARTVCVTLEKPADISRVVLYDNPSLADNVLEAEIVFENGGTYRSGPLIPGGAGTEIKVMEYAVTSFSVTLLKTEGENAGLTELEAYSKEKEMVLPYIKLMNAEGDFAYDYELEDSEEGFFYLYASDCADNLSSYTVQCDNVACSVEQMDEGIRVTCPKGQNCIVTVASEDGTLSDSVYIRSSGNRNAFGQKLEQWTATLYPNMQQSGTYRLLRAVYHLFREENLTFG